MKNWYTIATLALAVTTARAEEPRKPLEPPKGSVLVSLRLDEAAGSGFVVPGSRVDVVFKTTDPKTTVILEDLLVYAVESVDNRTTTTYAYSVCMTTAQSKVVAPLIHDKVKPQIILRAPDKK